MKENIDKERMPQIKMEPKTEKSKNELQDVVINSQGMRLLRVKADSFDMGGGDLEVNSASLPVHKVTLTEDFYISEEPVTLAQFAAYEQEVFNKNKERRHYRDFVIGVSYEEAVSFTEWLSKKEGENYHLPTEAEWEYTARQKDQIPADRMCDSHIREWCYDWYAPYDDRPVTDPAGPEDGNVRCVRGGYLDEPERYNSFPLEVYYRGALPASYKHYEEDTENDFGKHPIGFRVVLGRLPVPSGKQPVPYISVGVHQQTEDYRMCRPDSGKPYFRKRYLFPVPPDNCTGEEIRITGFPPSFRHHHHSPGFTAAPNGDLLYSVYSTYHEYDAESGLAGTRLRLGEDQWEMPDMFLDAVGVNDHAPLFFTDPDGTVYHFWGWPQHKNAFPFQYVTSKDNGEHWSPVRFPLFKNKAEHVVPQPVNTCIHAADGTFYMVSDSTLGASSVLWRSRDGLKTWENPKGRTAGRHTTAIELTDGSILAMGGKNSDISGYMPAAVTYDGGDTYHVSRTCFPALNSGQRPCILRLASGKLVFCGDYQNKKGEKPEGIAEGGSYAAWSEDEGRTWNFKTLWGTQKRKKTPEQFGGASTLGYSVAKQSPDGLIHVVCSNVQPLLHLCFNEAWLLGEETKEPSEEELMTAHAHCLVTERKEYAEFYENGKPKCIYHGGVADDGRFLLDGEEIFWYPDGKIMRKGTFVLGKRIGEMIYYDQDGYPVKRFTYPDEPGNEFDEWYETFWKGSRQVRTKAFFKNRKAEGEAYYWDREGKLLQQVYFTNGKIVEDYSLLKK